jgi:hypothetical protein
LERSESLDGGDNADCPFPPMSLINFSLFGCILIILSSFWVRVPRTSLRPLFLDLPSSLSERYCCSYYPPIQTVLSSIIPLSGHYCPSLFLYPGTIALSLFPYPGTIALHDSLPGHYCPSLFPYPGTISPFPPYWALLSFLSGHYCSSTILISGHYCPYLSSIALLLFSHPALLLFTWAVSPLLYH